MKYVFPNKNFGKACFQKDLDFPNVIQLMVKKFIFICNVKRLINKRDALIHYYASDKPNDVTKIKINNKMLLINVH